MALNLKRKRADDDGSRKVCLSIFYDTNFLFYIHRVAKLTVKTVNWRAVWTRMMVEVKKRTMLAHREVALGMMKKNGGE